MLLETVRLHGFTPFGGAQNYDGNPDFMSKRVYMYILSLLYLYCPLSTMDT
jgi:hypothetical protein